MNFLFIPFVVGAVVTIGKPDVATISVSQTKEIDYYILTKEEPLTIRADGPTWIRVFSRILWREDMEDGERYKIIVETDGEDERLVRMTAERSDISSVSGGEVSKWRSFFINVPADTHTYEFFLWRAKSDTVFLRFSSQSPRQWEEVVPISYNRRLGTVENEKNVSYYTGNAENPVVVRIDGPRKIKVVSRLTCSAPFLGEKVYGVAIYDNDEVVKRVNFNTERSETVVYKNDPEAVPSIPSITYVDIGSGEHILKFLPDRGTDEIAFSFYIRAKR